MVNNFESNLLLNYKKLNISDDEVLILLLAYALHKKVEFVNPSDLSFLCDFSLNKIDVIYSKLSTLGYINTDINNEGKVITSFTKIENELKKLNPSNSDKSNEKEVFDYLESFFGRLLTPLEYDVIQTWINNKYEFNLIKAACEVAKASNNKSIRYIDTIIFEETKKEELGDEEYQKRENETVDISHIDWLNK